MVDSINLKTRILRMREEHDFNNGDNDFNSLAKNPEKHKSFNKNALFTNSDIVEKNNINKKNTKNDEEKQKSSSLQSYDNVKLNNYDEQFKLLANNFNEAIEVILELSESVNKLENIIYSDKGKLNKRKYSNGEYKLKLIVLIIFITLTIFYLYFLSIDLNSISLFLDEILLLLK